MAQKVTVLLTDDLSGEEAAETVRFGLDSKFFEIDLSDTNAKALRGSLAEYIAAARKAGSSPRRTSTTGAGREENQAIRAWAKDAFPGEVSDRGRIPAGVVEAYHRRGA